MEDVNYYLSKGFDRKTAEYFATGRRKISKVKAVDNFLLHITFDNGVKKIFDCSDLPENDTVFEVLKDQTVFKRAYADENGNLAWDINPDIDSTKNWSNKIDIGADTCWLEGLSAN